MVTMNLVVGIKAYRNLQQRRKSGENRMGHLLLGNGGDLEEGVQSREK